MSFHTIFSLSLHPVSPVIPIFTYLYMNVYFDRHVWDIYLVEMCSVSIYSEILVHLLENWSSTSIERQQAAVRDAIRRACIDADSTARNNGRRYTHTQTHTHADTHTHINIHTHTRDYTQTHTYTHTSTHKHTHPYTSIHTLTHTPIHINILL